MTTAKMQDSGAIAMITVSHDVGIHLTYGNSISVPIGSNAHTWITGVGVFDNVKEHWTEHTHTHCMVPTCARIVSSLIWGPIVVWIAHTFSCPWRCGVAVVRTYNAIFFISNHILVSSWGTSYREGSMETKHRCWKTTNHVYSLYATWGNVEGRPKEFHT